MAHEPEAGDVGDGMDAGTCDGNDAEAALLSVVMERMARSTQAGFRLALLEGGGDNARADGLGEDENVAWDWLRRWCRRAPDR